MFVHMNTHIYLSKSQNSFELWREKHKIKTHNLEQSILEMKIDLELSTDLYSVKSLKYNLEVY